ncbi:MAG: hypothetical protein K2X03_03170 [Bryobacteraceae bacterium]|nr:hypothetical protein [Bryobacteraceae bacterium]
MTFLQWLENTPGSVYIRESLMFYPLVETAHVLALCLFLGMIALLDLRLVGAGLRTVPVSQVAARFLPLGLAGFAVMAISGLLLFYSGPVKAANNIFFQVKMALILLTGLNALLFHFTIYKRVAGWDLAPSPPLRAKLAGALSLVLWCGVVICGRMQAYNWFQH